MVATTARSLLWLKFKRSPDRSNLFRSQSESVTTPTGSQYFIIGTTKPLKDSYKTINRPRHYLMDTLNMLRFRWTRTSPSTPHHADEIVSGADEGPSIAQSTATSTDYEASEAPVQEAISGPIWLQPRPPSQIHDTSSGSRVTRVSRCDLGLL